MFFGAGVAGPFFMVVVRDTGATTSMRVRTKNPTDKPGPEYHPISTLLLRAGRGPAFRAPDMAAMPQSPVVSIHRRLIGASASCISPTYQSPTARGTARRTRASRPAICRGGGPLPQNRSATAWCGRQPASSPPRPTTTTSACATKWKPGTSTISATRCHPRTPRGGPGHSSTEYNRNPYCRIVWPDLDIHFG